MWIFAPGGLMMPASLPTLEVDKVVADPAFTRDGYFNMQVRGRVDSHLENFIRDYMDPMGLEHSDIQYTPQMDYNVRFYCLQEDYAKAIAAAIMDIDFQKFKPTAERYTLAEDGTTHVPMYKDGKEYHSILNSIWGTVCRLGSPGGVWGSYSKTNPNGYKARGSVVSYKAGQYGGYVPSYGAYDDDYADGWAKGDWDDTTLADQVSTYPAQGQTFLREEDLSEARKEWEKAIWPNTADDDGNASAWTSERDKKVEEIFLELMGVPESQWDEFVTTEEIDKIESFGRDNGLPVLNLGRPAMALAGTTPKVTFSDAVEPYVEQHPTRKSRRAAEKAALVNAGTIRHRRRTKKGKRQ